ncbi:MAG: hypothetical protein B1H11_00425 [Desulfobacteraceae bacterium 4484_190.1]|nr:MAG: hypothetical protein B1H11_00425 [Desulfobacteraceae bacterium 4484_190.1]
MRPFVFFGKSSMNEYKSKKQTNIIWKFFRSVKLTLFILLILAVTSILGTVIPQREGIMEFARRLNPDMFRLFISLDLFDMYHSIWFRSIIGCLALNLIICSIDRFPGALKLFRAQPRPDRKKPFENLPPEQTFIVKEKQGKTAERVSSFLSKRFKNVYTAGDQNSRSFYVEKGRFAHFGVYIVHSSLLFVITGSLLGSFFGFEAYVNIVEGDKTDTVILRKQKKPMKLNFEVRCDKFSVDFYENGAPKEYRSDLSFLVNGKDVKKMSLLVNHPVQFEGVTFYQANYGSVPGKKAQLKISRHSGKDDEITMLIESGVNTALPDNKGSFQIAKIEGDFMRMGPAVLISIQPDKGDEIQFWVFKDSEMIEKKVPGMLGRFPKLNPSAFKPYTFYLDDIESKYYTGLQVNKDPGVFFVWAGFFLIIAGFYVTFFTSHMRIWVHLSNMKKRTRISIAGTSGRDRVRLDRELTHLTGNIKELFN